MNWLNVINKRKAQILSERRKVCSTFFETIYNKFSAINNGDIPYIYDHENDCYVEAPKGRVQRQGSYYNRQTVKKNDYIFIGGYDFTPVQNKMPIEMAACMLGDMFGKLDGWEIEFNCANNFMYVYFRYMADYRLQFESQFSFKVINKLNNKVLGSNIPLDQIEGIIEKIRYNSEGEESVVDIADQTLWYVHLTRQRKPILFDKNKYGTYPNIYIGMLDKDLKIKYEPLIFYSPTKNDTWVSPDYKDHPYVREFIEHIRDKREVNNGRLQPTGDVQNQRRQDSNIGRPAFNQPQQRSPQEYRGRKPVYNPENRRNYR